MNDRILTDQERALGGLMEVAESQQNAVDTALLELGRLRGDLTHAVTDLKALGQKLPVSAEKAAAQAIIDPLKAHLATHAQAMVDLQVPLLKRLEASTAAAETADRAIKDTVATMEGRLKNAVVTVEQRLAHAEKRFGWRWALVSGVLVGCAIVALAAAAWGVVWWQRDQLADLQAQKEQLTSDLIEGRTMLMQLEKKTGGVRYLENSQGRFIMVPKGYDAWTCHGEAEIPCIRLK